MSSIALTFEAFEEPEPGSAWPGLFERHWPRYREWFLSEGEAARTTYADSVRALREHMPELVPTYERLCVLAGGGDLEARFLAMFAPPSYLSGCSQAVWREPETGAPLLVRNYDYAPERLEGAILSTAWAGKRVIGVSDCAWGLLDGINEDGLAVSLAFGGRKVVGTGFGVPLVVRYLLQTCATTEEARAVLGASRTTSRTRSPSSMRAGDTCTAYIAPDREVVLTDAAVATNHQGQVEWTEHARATFSLEREGALVELVSGGAHDLRSARPCVPDTAALPGRLRAADGDALHGRVRRAARARDVPVAGDRVGAELRSVRAGRASRSSSRARRPPEAA